MLTLRSGLPRLVAVALALVAGTSSLAAQATTGSIAGQITDSATRTPLAGARVQIVGTQLVATTRAEGRFTIRSVPVGEYEVRVLAVGYSSARTKVTVSAGGIAEANVAMVPVAYSLDDLVYTATGEQRRLEIGHTVGTIKADSIAAYSPISDLADLLQGRTAGVNILQSSGGRSPSSIRPSPRRRPTPRSSAWRGSARRGRCSSSGASTRRPRWSARPTCRRPSATTSPRPSRRRGS